MEKFWDVATKLGEIIIQIIGIICAVLLGVLVLGVFLVVICFIGCFWGLLVLAILLLIFPTNLNYCVYGGIIGGIICTIATLINFFKGGSDSLNSESSGSVDDDSSYKYHT